MNEPSAIPAVDPEKWQDLVGSLGVTAAEIVEAFLDDSPAKVKQLRQSLEKNDMASLGRLAHSLKSSSGIFGAWYMMNLCHDLEVAAHRADPACREVIEQITVAYHELTEELNVRLSELRNSE